MADDSKKESAGKSTGSKNRHAVILGRKGGRKGGLARATNLTPKERSESARKAVQARWAKYRAGKRRAKRNPKE